MSHFPWALGWLCVAGCASPPQWPAFLSPQGKPWPRTGEESVVQGGRRTLDVLFVVDSTTEGVDVRADLAATMPVFLHKLEASHVDYRVAAALTATGDTCGRSSSSIEFVGPESSDPVLQFAELIDVVPCDAETHAPSGFDAAFEVLGGSFRRSTAPLRVVVVSSVDDDGQTDVDEFVEALREQTSDVVMDTVAPPAAERYRDAAVALGGIVTDPSTLDEPLFGSLGNAAVGLGREFFLKGRPKVDTMEAQVERPLPYPREGRASEESVAFEYDAVRNSILLDEFVPRGTRVTVTYGFVSGTGGCRSRWGTMGYWCGQVYLESSLP